VKLSELNRGIANSPTPVSLPDEPATLGNGGDGAEGTVQKGTTPSVEEPWGVSQVLTPSELEIFYQAGPKRLYRIRDIADPTGQIIYHDVAGTDDPDFPWIEVPSVSTVLDVLEKGGLSWWGMKVGIAGALCTTAQEELLNDWPGLDGPEVDVIVKRLQAANLDVNKVRDKAADRGTNVHSALESWVESSVTPNPDLFPENERGYVQGLVAFINDAHPHPLHSELMVASTEGFAGRFDLLANLDFAGSVVTKTYPKRAPIRSDVSGAWLLDLKTSKDVYPSYHLQLAAYRQAMTECGYGEADHAGVVRVTADGRYELVESTATFEDFLHVLRTYHVVKGLK
jgi:hypothetical protein